MKAGKLILARNYCPGNVTMSNAYNTVEPPKRERFGTKPSVHYSEVVCYQRLTVSMGAAQGAFSKFVSEGLFARWRVH